MSRRVPVAWIPLAWLVACALPAHAGDVRGTLWMSREAQARAARAGDVPLAQPNVEDAVIWLDAIPAKLERRLAEPPHAWLWSHPKVAPLPCISQRQQRFEPRVLVVPAHSRVEFANDDRVYHNAFSVSAARRFDLGKHAPGRRDTLTFPRPGIVNLHCDIHPAMLGFVVVTPNHAFARPDADGRFTLPRLPTGHYVLHAWHPRHGDVRVAFDVPKRGDVVLNPRF